MGRRIPEIAGRSTSARSIRPPTRPCAWCWNWTGERIIRCTPHIGYLHSGFEKLGEHLNYNQYVTIVDRMDYSAPIYNELAWHGAAEKLMGVDLTPRCKVLRTIAGELGRIQSHLLCVGASGLDLGGADRIPLRLQ